MSCGVVIQLVSDDRNYYEIQRSNTRVYSPFIAFQGEESELDLSTSWSSCESDLRGNLSNDEGGDLGDDELSDWPDYEDDRNPRGKNGPCLSAGCVCT